MSEIITTSETAQTETTETAVQPAAEGTQLLLLPGTPKPEPPLTLFQHLMEINRQYEEIGGVPDGEIQNAAQPNIAAVSEILGITPLQTVLFAGIFCNYDGSDGIALQRFAEAIKCKPIELAQYLNEFRHMVDKGLIDGGEQEHRGRTSHYYAITAETLESVRKGTAPVSVWCQKYTPDEFLDRLSELHTAYQECADNVPQVNRRWEVLSKNNRHITMVENIKGYGLSAWDECILARFAMLAVQGEENVQCGDVVGQSHRTKIREIHRQDRNGTANCQTHRSALDAH